MLVTERKMGAEGMERKPPRTFADFTTEAARIGTGLLGWSPQVFWAATPTDLRLALEGRLGVGVAGDAAAEPLTRAEADRLAAQFPDGA